MTANFLGMEWRRTGNTYKTVNQVFTGNLKCRTFLSGDKDAGLIVVEVMRNQEKCDLSQVEGQK